MGYLFDIVHDLILFDARIDFSIPKIVFLTMELILPLFNLFCVFVELILCVCRINFVCLSN